MNIRMKIFSRPAPSFRSRTSWRLSLMALAVALAVAQGSDFLVVSPNLLTGGDAEEGGTSLFKGDYEWAVPSLMEVKNLPGDHSGQGKKCFALQMLGKEQATFTFAPQMAIDSSKIYRIRLLALTEEALKVQIAVFATKSGGTEPLTENGAVREFALKNPASGEELSGPVTHWANFEAVVGPAGSPASGTWPEKAAGIGLSFKLKGPEGATLFVDNICVEEVVPKP